MPINPIATTRIINLKTDAIIGCNDWERNRLQQVVITIGFEFDASEAISTDRLDATVDYRAMKKRVLQSVAASSFNLLESLTAHVLGIVMESSRVLGATVTVEKPKALRFADSVSVTLSGCNSQ